MRLFIPLTVTAGAYSANMCVGGKLQLSGVASLSKPVVITEAQLFDKNVGNLAIYDLIFFNADLAGAIADHVAYNIDPADIPKLLGPLQLATQTKLGTGGVMIGQGPAYKRIDVSSPDAWAALIVRNAVTFAATSDAFLILTTEQVPA